MERLYEYLRGEHADLRKTIARVDELTGRVWPTFLNCRVADSWPYELQQGQALPADIPDNRYSSSTSTMILFSLAMALGFVRKSPLTLGVLEGRPTETMEDRAPYEDAFREAMTRLIAHSMRPGGGPHGRPHVFDSKSFGKDDPFTLTWCAELLRAVQGSAHPAPVAIRGHAQYEAFLTKVFVRSRLKIETALSNPRQSCLSIPTSSEGIPLDHPFPLIRALQLVRSMTLTREAAGGAAPVAPLPVAASNACDEAKASMKEHRPRVYDYLLSRVHQQLSYHTMPNAQFDAAELVFALEGALLCSVIHGTADEELLHRVFMVVEERQNNNPYWRPLKPFVTTRQGFALLPLSVEIANCLLRVCTLLAQAKKSHPFFSRYLKLFTRYTEWLESRVDQGHTAPPPGGGGEQDFVGWHSEHVYVPQTVHTWETSQVLIYLLHFRSMLQKHIADSALNAAHIIPQPPEPHEQQAHAYWTPEEQGSEPLLAPDLNGSEYRIFQRISHDFLIPRESEATKHDHCSALLYGPPGTGKTRIAKQIATALQWPFVIIPPSDFVARGEAEVEMRAKSIFEVLNEQSQIVILFDEIDRLILDRDSRLYREQGDMFQFMTPGMLTKLHDLRDLGRVIFLISTNFADRIDPAAKRSGRIDDKLLVVPPGLLQRMNILQCIIEKKFHVFLPDDIVRPAARASVFAIYKELESMAVNAVRPLSGAWPPPLPQIRDALEGRAKDPPPAIRLTSYESRFKKGTMDHDDDADADFPSAQEPFEEFFVLVYLKCDAYEPLAAGAAPDPNAFNDVERGLIRHVAQRLVTDVQVDGILAADPGSLAAMRAALHPYLRHKHILEVLERWHYGI